MLLLFSRFSSTSLSLLTPKIESSVIKVTVQVILGYSMCMSMGREKGLYFQRHCFNLYKFIG